LGVIQWNFAKIFCITKSQSLGHRMGLFPWSNIYPLWYNTGFWLADRHTVTAYTALA